MSHSKAELEKAYIVLNIIYHIHVEADKKKRDSACVFFTPDVAKLFFDCLPEMEGVEVQGIVILGKPIKEINPEVGDKGLIGGVEFQVIRGYNKFYMGCEIFEFAEDEYNERDV